MLVYTLPISVVTVVKRQLYLPTENKTAGSFTKKTADFIDICY